MSLEVEDFKKWRERFCILATGGGGLRGKALLGLGTSEPCYSQAPPDYERLCTDIQEIAAWATFAQQLKSF